MTTSQPDRNTKKANTQGEEGTIKPDPETLDTSDPQEHMKGPVSSVAHEIEETFEGESDNDESEGEED